MYSTHTVEFRYLLLHKTMQSAFRYYSTQWMFGRILDLIHVSGISTVDENAAARYQKNLEKPTNEILNMINPFKEYEAERRVQERENDVKKRKFLDMLTDENPNGFTSLDDLQKSLQKVKEAFATTEGE